MTHSFRKYLPCVSLLALGSLTATAGAAPITWEIQGEVREVVNAPEVSALGVAPGTPFAVTIVLEPTTPDGDPSGDFGYYVGAVLSADFRAGAYQVASGASPEISLVEIDRSGPALAIQAQRVGALVGGLLDNPFFEVVAFPNVGGYFPSDALPLDPPSPADLFPYPPTPYPTTDSGSLVDVNSIHPTTGAVSTVRGSITSWRRVPESPELALAGLTLLLLLGQRLRAAAA